MAVVNSLFESAKSKTLLQRVLLIIGVMLFTGLFQAGYVDWLYPFFSYYGFENSNPSIRYLALGWAFSIIPSLWMPVHLSRPSQLIYWVLYLSVFIPSMFVPLYMGLVDISSNISMMIVMFVGFVILGASYIYPLPTLRPLQLSTATFWTILFLFCSILVLWVFVIFRGNLHVVSFSDIYDIRFAANDVTEGSLVNYAIMWLTGTFGPFLMAWGLTNRQFLICIAGVLIQLLIYSAVGTKASLLSIIVILGFAFILRDYGYFFGLKAAWGCAALFFFLYLERSTDPSSGSLMGWALSIILMRTFGNSGLSMEWYRDFFQRNPLTYYSHITGINWFVHYPYVNPLGLEVGSFYSGDPTLDQNANFWAMDGLGGGGLFGIILISLTVAVVFWLLDLASKKHDLRFTAVLVCFTAMNLANLSLFTTLLSGGLGFLILILYLMPSSQRQHLRNSVPSTSRMLRV